MTWFKDLNSACILENFIQFSSVAQSCPTLCDPMNCSTPGLPVHHQLPEFTQTHIHRVSDAIQPSHPLSSPSPPASSPSQHQGLFQWVNSSHEVAMRYWSFSLSISPSNEHPGLVSSRMDWLNLLSVQGTCKSLLRLCVFGGNTQKRCCVLTASYQVAHNVSLYHNYIC